MINRTKWALVTAGVAALLVLAAPWSFGDEALRREVAARLQSRTGLKAAIGGRMVLTLAPRPVLKLERVTLDDERGLISATAATLRAQLRLLPLIAGRIEFSTVDLSDAAIRFDADAIAPALAAARNSTASIAAEAPGRLSLSSSTVTISSAARRTERVEHVNGALEWASAFAPASMSISGDWNGGPVQLALWVADPSQLFNPIGSSTTIKLDSRPLTASLNGQLQLDARPQFAGSAAIAVADLGRALESVGFHAELPFPLTQVSATGVLKTGAQGFSLTEARLSADGNAFEGSIAFADAGARTLLSGTLATERLRMAQFLADLPSPIASDNSWSRDNLPKPALRTTDLDLRLSATRIRFPKFQMQDAGLVLKSTEGQLDISLIDARAYGGHLKGRFTEGVGQKGPSAKLTMSVSHLDAGALGGELLRETWLTGDLSGQTTLEGSGDCIEEIVQNLNGRVEATVENGDLIGIDLDQALRRTEKRPLSVPAEIRRGRTSFAKANFFAQIRDGKIEIDDAAAAGFNLATTMSGVLAAPDRTLALRLTANQTNVDGTSRPDAASLVVNLTGSWDDPRFDIDSDTLIRRSDAAAPLLKTSHP